MAKKQVMDPVSQQLVWVEDNKRTGHGSLAQLRDDYDQRRKAIEDNLELPEKAKILKLAQLKTEATQGWFKTKQELEAKAHNELQAAWKKANPTPNVANLTPGQIQARQEALADIAAITEAIDGSDPNVVKHAQGEAILNLYAKYQAMDYDLGMDTVAQRGSRYLNADQAKELQQIEEYRKPSLAEARQNLEQLRQSQSKDGTAQALLQSSFMQATALTGSENDALAQAPKPPSADAVAAWQQMNA